MIKYIEFDGYCPESQLNGEKVEMRLNDMDFWESVKTGLQITTFPPYAAILRWRGEGKFRETHDIASNHYTSLILTGTEVKTGCEILPDSKLIFQHTMDLEEYILNIDKSYSEFEENRFNENDPVFEVQKKRLEKITREQCTELLTLFDKCKKDESSKEFAAFHEKLYEMGLIFDFKWMRWYDGYDILEDTKSDYSQLSLLKVSMLLTSIFRSDRFNPGTIKIYLENGVIKTLIGCLNQTQI